MGGSGDFEWGCGDEEGNACGLSGCLEARIELRIVWKILKKESDVDRVRGSGDVRKELHEKGIASGDLEMCEEGIGCGWGFEGVKKGVDVELRTWEI